MENTQSDFTITYGDHIWLVSPVENRKKIDNLAQD